MGLPLSARSPLTGLWSTLCVAASRADHGRVPSSSGLSSPLPVLPPEPGSPGFPSLPRNFSGSELLSCPGASRVSRQETLVCRFRAGLGDTAASSGIHFPRFGAWPGPDLTGGQAGHLTTAWPPATPQPSPQLLREALGGSRDPRMSTTHERGWGQDSAGSWIQLLN